MEYKGIFDTHAHYDDERFDEDRSTVLGSLAGHGVSLVVDPACDLASCEKTLELSHRYGFLYSAVGVHPHSAESDGNENWLFKVEKFAKQPKVVAIGEIGLDYYWNKENKEKQKELFIKQIEIANRLNKPIVIHTRDAYIDTIEILKKHQVNKKGIFHCCPLNQELIKEGLKLGFYISFSGNITFKNAKAEAILELVPMDKMLIETDSPYLTPEPFRGKRNNPSMVKLVAQRVSEVKKVPIETVTEITYKNANEIFNI